MESSHISTPEPTAVVEPVYTLTVELLQKHTETRTDPAVNLDYLLVHRKIFKEGRRSRRIENGSSSSSRKNSEGCSLDCSTQIVGHDTLSACCTEIQYILPKESLI
jgi:hypothetical protein